MTRISEIMLIQQAPQPALIIEAQTDMSGLPPAIEGSFMKIGAYLQEEGIAPTDIPFVMYKDFESMTEQNIKMVIGFKLSKALPNKGEISCIQLPEQKMAMCLHKGNYKELVTLYNEMLEWIRSQGYQAEGTSIEYYYSGPEVPEDEQVTRIEMPLKK